MLLFALAATIFSFTKDGIVYESENMVQITGVTSEFSGFLALEPSVKIIGDGAFRDCSAITGILIGEHVELIGCDAFIRSSIENVTIQGVSQLTISKGAFAWCSQLKYLNISGTGVSITAEAFAHCKLLERVCMSDSVSIDQGAFDSRAQFTCEVKAQVDPGLEKGMKAFSITLIVLTFGALILGFVLQITVPNKHDPENVWQAVGKMDAVPNSETKKASKSRNPLQEPLNYSVPV